LEREENNGADLQLPQMCVVGPIKKVTDTMSFPHVVNADLEGLEAKQVKKTTSGFFWSFARRAGGAVWMCF